jgi:hypothetical protein
MPNGDAIVTWIMGENEQARSWIARLSGMDGSTAWAARLDRRQLYVVGLAGDANGDIAVSLDGIYGSQDSVIKLAGEDGSRLWARDRQAGAVAFHEAGGVIVGSVGAEGFQITLLASTNGSLLNAVPMHFGDLANVTLAMSAAGDIALAGSTWANPPATVHYPDTQAFVSKLPK